MDMELRKVQRLLLDRLGGDPPSDYWATGDLAIVSALLGDGRAMKKGLTLFTAPSTPAFAYEAYLKTLTMLLGVKHPQSRHLRIVQQGLLRAKATVSGPVARGTM